MKNDRWSIITGSLLILIGVGFILQQFLDFTFRWWGVLFGGLFLVTGIAFLGRVFQSRAHWWALIPGLPLTILGAVLGIGAFFPMSSFVGPAVLLGLGLAFLIIFILQPLQWWALIPGFILSGIGTILVIDYFVPQTNENLIGALVMASIGLAFFAVFVHDRTHWWAIIPGGATMSVAAVILTGEPGYLFAGLGITFALVALLSEKENWWAWIPCGVLTVMAMFFLITSDAVSNLFAMIFFPALLILLGGYVIARAIFQKK
ncbi:MAG: hypothetical protein JW750_06430 [Anaerolineaceae bacterium]|nr:hypothetical protein [Anaerolineaceae bacterium]